MGDEELEEYQNGWRGLIDEIGRIQGARERNLRSIVIRWKLPDPFSMIKVGCTAVNRDGLLEGRAKASRHVLVFARFAPGVLSPSWKQALDEGD